jgi:hypothetical protein
VHVPREICVVAKREVVPHEMEALGTVAEVPRIGVLAEGRVTAEVGTASSFPCGGTLLHDAAPVQPSRQLHVLHLIPAASSLARSSPNLAALAMCVDGDLLVPLGATRGS